MRRQILLGTTALMIGAAAAPGIAAAEEQPIRLSINGFLNEFIGVGDVSDNIGTNYGNTNIFNDGEINFNGETTLDNGLTFGVSIDLETTNIGGGTIDENFAYVSGDFGKVEVGSQNFANYTTFWDVTAPAVGTYINSGWITIFVPIPSGLGTAGTFLSPLLTTNIDIGNDENQISYYSPRFAGFQFTGGYAPQVGGATTPSNRVANKGTTYNDAWGVGLNFANEFNGISLGFAAGYNSASVDTGRKALGAKDIQQIKAGASVGFAGFTVAGSYARQLEGAVDATNTFTNKGTAFDVGAKYETGPWAASVTYFRGEQKDDVTIAANDTATAVVGAVSYAVGPGITTSLSVFYGKFEEEGGGTAKSTLGVLGLSLSF